MGEDGLKNVNKGGKRRGWSVSEHNGKTRLRLQFPKTGDEWPANAQTNLPYSWEADSIDDITLLINRIYTPVMARSGVTLKAAIDDALGISDKKAQEVVTPWPGIVAAFREHKLTLDNRIAEKTFEASYGRYLNVALLHLDGRNAAQTGKAADGEGSDPSAGQPEARQETRRGSQALGRDAEVTVGVLPGTEEISGIRRRRTPATSSVPDRPRRTI